MVFPHILYEHYAISGACVNLQPEVITSFTLITGSYLHLGPFEGIVVFPVFPVDTKPRRLSCW